MACWQNARQENIYYTYDGVGRVTSGLGGHDGPAYYQDEGLGRRTAAWQESCTHYWSYDAAGRLSRHTQGPWTVYHTFDARGAVAQVTDPWGQTVYFTRDEIGAEIARELPRGAVSYLNYDAAGRPSSLLHTKSDGGVLIGLYYTYDDDGLPVHLDGRQGSLLEMVTLSRSEAWEYAYGPRRQRWRKHKEALEESTAYFVYDGARVLQELDGGGAVQSTYTHTGRSIYSALLAQRGFARGELRLAPRQVA